MSTQLSHVLMREAGGEEATLMDVADRFTEDELRHTHGIGAVSFLELKALMSRCGLDFRDKMLDDEVDRILLRIDTAHHKAATEQEITAMFNRIFDTMCEYGWCPPKDKLGRSNLLPCIGEAKIG